MHSIDLHRCRVCGLFLEDPPWGYDEKTPLYEYCPCCGVEFGYQDATPIGARAYREEWLAAGAKWDEPTMRPASWSASEQLRFVPEEFR